MRGSRNIRISESQRDPQWSNAFIVTDQASFIDYTPESATQQNAQNGVDLG
jgi:hypothetical protein